MGGMYHPTLKGIMIGRIAGLRSSVSIVNYILDVGIQRIEIPEYYTVPGTEFYIGFGTGYELGQQLRVVLKNDTSNQMTLDEKVDCLSFVLEKQELCKEDVTTSFLHHIKYWEVSKLPAFINKDVTQLLHENKIQRAVDRLFTHLKDNFHLKLLKEFYVFYERLKALRTQKKNHKKYNLTKELDALKLQLHHWMNSKK